MRISELNEMATPSDAMRNKAFFHGTPDTASAQSIQQNGLRGVATQGRGHLSPVAGKVYLTGDIAYAIMYALGGNYNHEMMEEKNFSDPYGYVFVIRGVDLVDVQPDEDSVGEYIHNHAKVVGEHSRYHYAAQFAFDPSTGDDTDAKIWHNLRGLVTDNQFSKIMQGEYSAFASGGKRALKTMTDWMKVEMINRGAHLAHEGSIHPSECWRILKTDMSKLKRDGSNFFTVAERINGMVTEGETRIVFDGPPSPEGAVFVEVENEHGQSISAGDWRERPDGYWELVISSL